MLDPAPFQLIPLYEYASELLEYPHATMKDSLGAPPKFNIVCLPPVAVWIKFPVLSALSFAFPICNDSGPTNISLQRFVGEPRLYVLVIVGIKSNGTSPVTVPVGPISPVGPVLPVVPVVPVLPVGPVSPVGPVGPGGPK